jgi:hypothetical protein
MASTIWARARPGSFKDLAEATFRATGREPDIAYVDMPEVLRGKYQYFTQAKMDRLRAAGYTAPMTSLEDGVEDYVAGYLNTTIRMTANAGRPLRMRVRIAPPPPFHGTGALCPVAKRAGRWRGADRRPDGGGVQRPQNHGSCRHVTLADPFRERNLTADKSRSNATGARQPKVEAGFGARHAPVQQLEISALRISRGVEHGRHRRLGRLCAAPSSQPQGGGRGQRLGRAEPAGQGQGRAVDGQLGRGRPDHGRRGRPRRPGRGRRPHPHRRPLFRLDHGTVRRPPERRNRLPPP